MAGSASVLTVRTTGSPFEVSHPSRFPHISSEILKKSENHQMILNELEVISVIPMLRQNEVITAEELSRIRAQRQRRLKVAELLDILYSRVNDSWVAKFLDILDKSGEGRIIQMITTNSHPPHFPMPTLRNVQYQERVMFYEDDIEDSIRRSYNPEKLKIIRETMNCDIVDVYYGSVCFLLDPLTLKAMEDLFDINISASNVGRFLSLMLDAENMQERFKQKRLVTVEITERKNAFIFRMDDTSSEQVQSKGTSVSKCISAEYCTGCYRQTIIDNYCSILDEIETTMMEKTFKGHAFNIPGFIRKACIDDKMDRSRQERAHIFLRFILNHEQLLVDFVAIFRQLSDMMPKTVPCEQHSGQAVPFVEATKKVTLHFTVQYESTVNAVIVESVSERMNEILKLLGGAHLAASYRHELLHILESHTEIKNEMINVDTEENNFNRIAMFLLDIVPLVVKTYFENKILRQISLQTFLNTHKHTLYHISVLGDCCQCHFPLEDKRPQNIVSTDSFELLFERKCSPQHKDNCICAYSARQNIDTSVLDLKLACSIMMNCGHALYGIDEQKLLAIIEIRKKLMNCSFPLSISKSDFDIIWENLSTAVLGLAFNVNQDYVNRVAGDIGKLRIHTIETGDRLKTVKLFRGWMEEPTAEIEHTLHSSISNSEGYS